MCIRDSGMATAAMLRAGANIGATGENAAVYNCRDADIIAGPIGIMQALSLIHISGDSQRTVYT